MSVRVDLISQSMAAVLAALAGLLGFGSNQHDMQEDLRNYYHHHLRSEISISD